MNKSPGYVAEFFAGIQGEGSWAGHRQIFLRLAGCREKCAYCDTPQSRRPRPRRARVVFPGLDKKTLWLPNPLDPAEAVHWIGRLLQAHGPFQSLAITGGEPLEQGDFVKACLRELKSRHWHLPVLLETNGHRVEDLAKVVRALDFMAADIKLHSATGVATPWARHVEFLKLARRLEGCVKVVVVPATSSVEIVHAARVAGECVPHWDMILQPAAGVPWKLASNRRRLETFMQTACRVHPRVRLLPQIHKVMGWA